MNSCCFPPRSFYDVHKYFHYLLASKLARQIQGGITAYIPEFQVRASRNERTRRRKIVADDGLHQRCHTEAVLRIHVGTTPDQGLHARGRGSRRLEQQLFIQRCEVGLGQLPGMHAADYHNVRQQKHPDSQTMNCLGGGALSVE